MLLFHIAYSNIEFFLINKSDKNIIKKLNKLLPKIFPHAICVLFILIHDNAIANSGRLVDKAKKRVPVKLAFNPKPPLEMSKDIIFPMEDINTPRITTIKLIKINFE